MTVVPDPEKVMRELARVCRPGGEVILAERIPRSVIDELEREREAEAIAG